MIDKEYVKGIVCGISSRKKECSIVPSYATVEEIMAFVRNDVAGALDGLCAEGSIEIHRTLNSSSYGER